MSYLSCDLVVCADGGPEIGRGHVARMRAVSRAAFDLGITVAAKSNTGGDWGCPAVDVDGRVRAKVALIDSYEPHQFLAAVDAEEVWMMYDGQNIDVEQSRVTGLVYPHFGSVQATIPVVCGVSFYPLQPLPRFTLGNSPPSSSRIVSYRLGEDVYQGHRVTQLDDLGRHEFLSAVVGSKAFVTHPGVAAYEAIALGARVVVLDSLYPDVARWMIAAGAASATIDQAEKSKRPEPGWLATDGASRLARLMGGRCGVY